ncbi:zinc-binding metallopeptidase family protein [Cupriavidus plantarum]|uniref:zinc-binding metallopeptidase family protein n=1 Tax=Cupriavidus plantarum TaxID=942865 RepID=UPI000EAD0324|nr:putative zinc-binding metallopeptidase [Cupriavidus plantarum]RLK29998.1 hypothetical protein C7417_5101 [Cupriavidus plantarum]
MKTFHCTHCQSLVFFESFVCNRCQAVLGYVPALREVGAFEGSDEHGWRMLPEASAQTYRRCANYAREHVCNWMVPVEDSNPLCESCRLTRVIPALAKPDNRLYWYRLEQAKRRLLYSLSALHLPTHFDGEGGDLTFKFLEDVSAVEPVMTGHDNGCIVVNVKEANDVERETTRAWAGEAYRTLLGHLRHESGHFYFQHLIAGTHRIQPFRKLFGDERMDYAAAQKHYYDAGPPSDHADRFISAYASMHPFEDWAETWAHYLHMVDTLDTANWSGLTLQPRAQADPGMTDRTPIGRSDFQSLLARWQPLTYAMNSLNRSLGLPDAYPFSLSPAAVDKLHFVHRVITAASKASS